MFSPAKKFLALFAGAFFSNRLPKVIDVAAEATDHELPKQGKGRGRRAHRPSGIAKSRRASRKARNVACNRAHHG